MTKVFKVKQFIVADTFFSPYLSVTGQISWKTVDATYPINLFEDEGFSQKTSARFRLLKIQKHVNTKRWQPMKYQNLQRSQYANLSQSVSYLVSLGVSLDGHEILT